MALAHDAVGYGMVSLTMSEIEVSTDKADTSSAIVWRAALAEDIDSKNKVSTDNADTSSDDVCEAAERQGVDEHRLPMSDDVFGRYA